jgi:hypothetical protein
MTLAKIKSQTFKCSYLYEGRNKPITVLSFCEHVSIEP